MDIPLPEVVFEELIEGSRRQYDILVAALKKNNSKTCIEDLVLGSIISGVHLHVVKLNRQYASIALEIMKVQWTGKSLEVVDAYESFMLDLVSVHTGIYLNDCLRTIVKNFKPPPNSSEEETFTGAFNHNHHLLASIAAIVPKVTLDLKHILSSMFIYHSVDKHIQTNFVSNMLHISTYLPSLRPLIINLCFKLLTELDARSARKDILKAMKGEEDGPDKALEIRQGAMKHHRVDVLDALMCILFKHIRKTCFIKGVLNYNETKTLYLEFIDSFESLILTPSKICHTQFILFHLCSFHKTIQEHFMMLLWRKVTSPSQEPLYRQLSSLYLSGLLSRAKYITIDTILQHLTLMRDWIEVYSDNTIDCHKHLDHQQQRHSSFYFLCQAFFHVIVCRHKLILESSGGHSFLMALFPQRIVFSRLNPLNYCLPSVAEAFCAVLRNNQIAFCDTVLERNRRLMTSSNASTTPSLLSYAPFDPYLLENSKEYIAPLYQEYDNLSFQPGIIPCLLREDMEYLDLEEHMSFSPKHSDLFHQHMLPSFL